MLLELFGILNQQKSVSFYSFNFEWDHPLAHQVCQNVQWNYVESTWDTSLVIVSHEDNTKDEAGIEEVVLDFSVVYLVEPDLVVAVEDEEEKNTGEGSILCESMLMYGIY